MLSFEYPVYYCRVVRSFQLVVARVRSASYEVSAKFTMPENSNYLAIDDITSIFEIKRKGKLPAFAPLNVPSSDAS